jgi:ABC-type uncharacterized transport system involved in gliding motility auxiliary subunit
MLQRILGIVGWLGTGLVFVALAVRIAGRTSAALPPQADQYAVYAAWAGLICVLLYAAGQWREFLAFFKRRQARYGTLATTSVIIALGLLIAVNYLATRQKKRWDLTSNQQFSLSDQTVKLLHGLDGPVKILAFDQAANLDRLRTKLAEYEYQSDKVDVEYIDADRQPLRTKEYEIQSYGTIVVQKGDRRERVTTDSEQDITNALIKVVTGQQKKAYFVQGHGEKDTASTERSGYSAVTAALGRDNYAVEKVVLAQQKAVPEDASVLIVAGPQTDLLQGEAEMLRRYLARGGHLLLLLDPPQADNSAGMPNLEALAKEWGIQPGHDVVLDVSGMGQLIGADASVPVAATYPTHAITQGFSLMTAFPLARSVSPVQGGANGRTAQTIIETSPRSWAETNLKELQSDTPPELNEQQGDKQGPVSIAAAVSAPAADAPATPGDAAKAKQGEEPKKPEARVAVIGDSDFAANAVLGVQGNSDLFLNTVNWLAEQENLIAIRPKEAADRRLTMTAGQQDLVFWLSVVVIPMAVFATGIYGWWRRR